MTTVSTSKTPPPDTSGAPAATLMERFETATATIAVVGLGYVGLPLVRAAHEAGFSVVGYDRDRTKIDTLNRGETYLKHLGDDLAKELAASERFKATAESKDLVSADAILLCVPTPLGPHREPDLSFVLDSTKMVAGILRKGQLVVLESTTYPGTTRDEMLPILEKESGLRCGKDFFLAYSPEREDPGRPDYNTATIPKLVGGVDEVSTDLAVAMYRSLVSEVHRVSTAEVAEAAKLLENIYRAVNIAMVNELKTLLADMKIDIWEVIEAASTKPFGYQAFYPGPGLGGHCIPIDPFYLTWKAKAIGRNTKFIELAGEINAQMPVYVVSQVISALNARGRALKGAKVLIIGIAYKRDIDDVRESPAAEIIELLWAGGAKVAYHDPLVPTFPDMRAHDIDLSTSPLTEQTLKDHDCVLIVTDHTSVDYEKIGKYAPLVVDTRNAMSRVPNPTAAIVKA
ncbi:MAG: nucleotide sugar dehydrogenase [Planctomycetes bacterium]|nr:nucleotide sugar dehydrogenase [Planctomycetota bacterium]MCH8211416.1 nucleotide sugar dehydrogenase [Planctomycetota bacterium]